MEDVIKNFKICMNGFMGKYGKCVLAKYRLASLLTISSFAIANRYEYILFFKEVTSCIMFLKRLECKMTII